MCPASSPPPFDLPPACFSNDAGHPAVCIVSLPQPFGRLNCRRSAVPSLQVTPAVFSDMKRQLKQREDGGWARVQWDIVRVRGRTLLFCLPYRAHRELWRPTKGSW